MAAVPVTAPGLVDIARRLVGAGKGLLAMDESNGTCNKRFADVGIVQTEEARRTWRELLVTTPGLGDSIGGAILYDETIQQPASEIWEGKGTRVAAAQGALRHRAHCNRGALQGEYSIAMERT